MAGYERLRLRLGLKGVEFPSFAARVSGCSQAHWLTDQVDDPIADMVAPTTPPPSDGK